MKEEHKNIPYRRPDETISLDELKSFLWGAATRLRGQIDAAGYKEYIFPLLFFKRISDVYDEQFEDFVAEGGEEYAGMQAAELAIRIPDGAHWRDVREVTENVGQRLVEAFIAIEQANPGEEADGRVIGGLDGIFGPKDGWTNKNKMPDHIITSLIEDFSRYNLGLSSCPADEMGQAYEYLVGKFADDAGNTAQEFYTNRTVVTLMAEILQPKPDESIYDPTCGSGGMLIEAVHHMNHSSLCCGNIFGQEKNVVNSAIAKMNLFLHGASDFNIMQGDTLRNPKILQGGEVAKFDCVIANPPFSLEKWGSVEWSSDKYGRNIWGTPSDSCGDYAWIQHMIASMAPGKGRMAVVMPQGVLFRGNEEGRIREKLVKSDMVEAVVTLGDKLFYGTGLSPCFLIIRKMKPAAHSARILMIDGTKILTPKRAQNILEQKDVDRLFELYINYENVEDFSQVVTLDDIAAKGYDLSPNKYVQYHREAIKPYTEVLAEFKAAYEEVKLREAEFRKIINA